MQILGTTLESANTGSAIEAASVPAGFVGPGGVRHVVRAARLLNPSPTIDPALGIVVTEYFNRAGQMTEQYPTVKMVDSYRIYGLHPDTASRVSTA